jgi:hypothetical protein
MVGHGYRGTSDADILKSLEKVFREFGRPDAWEVAKAWLSTKGIK